MFFRDVFQKCFSKMFFQKMFFKKCFQKMFSKNVFQKCFPGEVFLKCFSGKIYFPKKCIYIFEKNICIYFEKIYIFDIFAFYSGTCAFSAKIPSEKVRGSQEHFVPGPESILFLGTGTFWNPVRRTSSAVTLRGPWCLEALTVDPV